MKAELIIQSVIHEGLSKYVISPPHTIRSVSDPILEKFAMALDMNIQTYKTLMIRVPNSRMNNKSKFHATASLPKGIKANLIPNRSGVIAILRSASI